MSNRFNRETLNKAMERIESMSGKEMAKFVIASNEGIKFDAMLSINVQNQLNRQPHSFTQDQMFRAYLKR